MYTKYYTNKGLYFGGQQVMTPDTVQRWTKQFKAGTKELTGLVLKTPQEIAGGNLIGYRPEHQTYLNIGRAGLIRGGTLLEPKESSSFIPKPPPLTQTTTSSFVPKPTSTISTPSLYNTRPTNIIYPHIDPYGASSYLGLSYTDLSREIERARFQRKLELLEEEYRKERKKKPKRRKSSKKKRRKSSKKKRK